MSIEELKLDYVDKLKRCKQEIENKKDNLIVAKMAEKRKDADIEVGKINDAFERYKTEKLNAYNKDVEDKAKEVKEKTLALYNKMKTDVEIEVTMEISSETRKYEAEINKLERELGL